MTRSSDTVLSLTDVTITFGGVVACEAIDLQVERGQIHALIGPNGAGKTSVVNAISGVYIPKQGGRIQLFDPEQEPVDLIGVAPHIIVRRGISRTFQHLGTIPFLTVQDNLLLGRCMHERSGVFASALRARRSKREELLQLQRITEIMDVLGLLDLAHLRVQDLPYGTQKLVDLGRALAADPKVLLLDEPVAGMVRSEKQEVVRVIEQLRRQFDLSILVVEHDMSVVVDLADHITVLDFGRKIADGEPQAVLSSEAVIAAYLGPAIETA